MGNLINKQTNKLNGTDRDMGNLIRDRRHNAPNLNMEQ